MGLHGLGMGVGLIVVLDVGLQRTHKRLSCTHELYHGCPHIHPSGLMQMSALLIIVPTEKIVVLKM